MGTSYAEIQSKNMQIKKKMNIVCFGSSGFIGGQLVKRLKAEGHFVVGADIEYPKYTHPSYFMQTDLRIMPHVMNVLGDFRLRDGIDQVFCLAALMGGAGYIFSGDNDAEIMHSSALINLNILDGLRQIDFKGKVFYSSSACMYPQEIQQDYHNKGLKESDAYPLNPDSDYGLEKAFSERLYLAYQRNYGLNVRIARFHNIYGPEGTYTGGKEKAPAAMCRKVVESSGYKAPDGGYTGATIEIWGTGHQTRSFLYIDDCLDAVRLLMDSYFKEPINIGSEEMVTINQLAGMAIGFSGKTISIKHISGPTGVMGRNSNNELIEKELGWKPKYSLKEGLKLTYDWIYKEMGK